MSVLVLDPEIAGRLLAEREATDGAQHDEVWDGVYVMSPLPNIEHLVISAELWLVFRTVLNETNGGIAFNTVNVSDRVEGWEKNFREPDVAVVLKDNPAVNCGTHWRGGPDLVVEILSPNDRAREKFDFYARIGVREVLIIDRAPWRLELYRLADGELKPVGVSSLDQPDTLPSTVFPVVFRLVAGPERPQVEVTRSDGSHVGTV